jgi:hypothetical protein
MKVLTIDPPDLTTGHAGGVVMVYTAGAEPQLIEIAKKEVFLRPVDGGPNLPILVEDLGSEPGTSQSRFSLRPATTLDSRWHLVAFRTLPEDAEVNQTDRTRLSDGFLAIRFHPASGPTLREVWSCPKGGRTLVDVHLSERVALEEISTKVQANLGGDPCSLETAGFGDGTGDTFRFWCNATQLADVEVVFHPGLKGFAGGDFKLLNGESSAALTFTLSAGQPRDEVCRVWRPQ